MIQGHLIDLRALEPEDMPLLVEWRNSPEVYNYYYYGCEPISLFAQKRWFEQWASRTDEKLFMITLKDRTPIGTIGMVKIDLRSRKAEGGRLLLGKLEWREQGYGAEAQYLLFKYAFEHLNLHKIYVEVFKFHTAIISLHKKFGMTQAGLLKEHVFRNGQYEDIIIMELFREDFNAQCLKLERLFSRSRRFIK